MGWEALILRLTVKGQRRVQKRAPNNFLGSVGYVLLTPGAISKPFEITAFLCWCWRWLSRESHHNLSQLFSQFTLTSVSETGIRRELIFKMLAWLKGHLVSRAREPLAVKIIEIVKSQLLNLSLQLDRSGSKSEILPAPKSLQVVLTWHWIPLPISFFVVVMQLGSARKKMKK